MNGKAILASLITIGVAATMLGVGVAQFFDSETSTGNTFTAGTLDLTVNGLDDPYIYELVTLDDMKPCYWKYVTITLHVEGNDANCWIMFTDVASDEGVNTEPELEDPLNDTAEIADYITVDVKIDNTVIIDPGEHRKLSNPAIINLGTLEGCHDYTLTLSFHLQEEVTNWAQGDVATFSIVFGAEQV